MATLRSASRWTQDPENPNRFIHANPYELTEEDKGRAAEAKTRYQLEMQEIMDRINIRSAANKDWGPRPEPGSKSIWEPSAEQIPEGERLSRILPETGTEYSPATETGGIKKFSDDPRFTADPSVGYMKRPPPAKGPDLEDDVFSVDERNMFIDFGIKQTFKEDLRNVDKGAYLDEKLGAHMGDKDPAYIDAAQRFDDIRAQQWKFYTEMKDGYDTQWKVSDEKKKAQAEADKASGADVKAKQDKYISLGRDYIRTLTDKQKLADSLGTTFDETAKDAIKAQIQELDNFANDIKFQMKGLEGTPGVKPVKVDTTPYKGRFFSQMGLGTGETGKTQNLQPETPQQKEAKSFAANARARGLTKEQTIAEYKKLKLAGSVGKATPAKIVKPAQTMPISKKNQIYDDKQTKVLGEVDNVEIMGVTRNGFKFGYAPGYGTVIYTGNKWKLPAEYEFDLIKDVGGITDRSATVVGSKPPVKAKVGKMVRSDDIGNLKPLGFK